MATEPAARTDPDPPPRHAARAVPARARDAARRHGLQLPGVGRVDRSTSTAARAAWSGTSTATSSSTCGWATARSSSATATTASTTTSTSGCAAASASRSPARTRSGRWSSSRSSTGWVDKARMTVSGTEATMHAMRIARAYTGREKIVKFEGQYHGVHDYALISVGPDDMSELGDADAPGRPGLGPRHPGRRRGHDHPGPLQQHRPPAHAVRASAARRSPRSSSSRSSATPRGSCPSRASTRRCGP